MSACIMVSSHNISSPPTVHINYRIKVGPMQSPPERARWKEMQATINRLCRRHRVPSSRSSQQEVASQAQLPEVPNSQAQLH